MKIRTFLCAALATALSIGSASAAIHIIPRPLSIVETGGEGQFACGTIACDGLFSGEARMLAEAVARGFEVILNPRRPAYLDFLQHESHKTGRRWNGINPLEQVYAFPESYASHVSRRPSLVMGVQSVLFSETVNSRERLDFVTFPRLVAMAEDGWTAVERKDYADFLSRLPFYLGELDRRGIGYFDPFATPVPDEVPGPAKKHENPIANG